jgi:hypothetical protein
VQPGDDPLRTSGYLDETVEILDSPVWKIAMFRLNGWPRLPVECNEQAWRPWHRWRGRRDGSSRFG